MDFVQANGFENMNGNANTWSRYVNTASPSIGDAVVLKEGGSTGHVALVVGVSSTSIGLEEMNYKGYGIISSRTIPLDYANVVGYITPPPEP